MERGQLRWFEHLIRMLDMPIVKRPKDTSRTHWRDVYLFWPGNASEYPRQNLLPLQADYR